MGKRAGELMALGIDADDDMHGVIAVQNERAYASESRWRNRPISARCAAPAAPSSWKELSHPGAARPRSLRTTRPLRPGALRLLP